jgi:hypothetical protein
MKRVFPIVLAFFGLIAGSSQSSFAQCEGSVSGVVTIAGEPCVACSVTALMEPQGSLVWQTVDEAITDLNGQYSVVLPENSTVILLVKAANNYLNAVPTFSGSVIKWGLALSFDNTCNHVFTGDVAIVTHPTRSGITTLRGRVFLSPGKMQAEGPVSGVDIVVERTQPGLPNGATVTDAQGDFLFENIESDLASTYTVRVNLPCVPNPNTYIVTVNPEDIEIGGIDFCIDADTTTIFHCLVTGVETNPDGLIAKKATRIAMDSDGNNFALLFDGKQAQLTLYTLNGAVVLPQTTVLNEQRIPIDQLRTGIYIAEIIQDGNVQRLRMPKY